MTKPKKFLLKTGAERWEDFPDTWEGFVAVTAQRKEVRPYAKTDDTLDD